MLSRLAKNSIQTSSVVGARPSRNRPATGLPVATSTAWPRVVGSMFSVRNTRCAFGDTLPRRSRKRGDSGSQINCTGISASGSTPPTTKIDVQPKIGSISAINWPPRKPPIGLPTNTSMMTTARIRSGA